MSWSPLNENAFCYSGTEIPNCEQIEVGESLTKLSKEFGVGISTVGDARRDSEKISLMQCPMANQLNCGKVRKPNGDDNNSESDEDEVIVTSKISNSDASECFAKGLMWLEQQTDP
ncbi:hypothetical protein AVEN_70271-1 [Araneus ventricosus]|uniref:HTH psq-type domain-containing protein n=1 Tax=Araneus ventricosus TaxID=182803 RepID=A0A4Y2PL19_ARAVE|nr:hypothetical protein AVEN_70271-1 [Araneus ventricosus]